MVKKIIFLTVAIGLVGIAFFVFDPMDRCLDAGGKWNQELEKCEGRAN